MKKPTLKLRLLSPLWIVIGLTVLIISLATGQVYGQVLDADRVKQEIEQTDNIIEQARKSVDQSRDQRTTALLQQAEQAQERAREYLERGRLALALQFTLRAREAARRCIGSMVRSDDDRSIVEQQLDRTDELLEQIRTITQNGESPALDLRLQEAQRLQDRARDFFTENNLRQSLQFTRRSQEICRNLLEQVSGGERRRENLHLNLDRAQDFVSDNREAISACNDEIATRLFDSGSEQIDKSEQLYQAGNYEESIRMLAGGLSRVRRAVQNCGGTHSESDAERAIATAQSQLERLRERAQETGSRDADKLLDEATEKLDQARNLHELGEEQRALVVVRVVIELNQQAARILGAW